MKKHFLIWSLLLGCGVLSPSRLFAQDLDSPFDPHLQYSADIVFATDQGMNMQELYCDNGKVRLEMTEEGRSMATIIRPDEQKFYHMLIAQKVVLDLPYKPDEFRNQIFAVAGAHGQYQLVGAEETEGVNCMKYKGTAGPDKRAYFIWIDAATKAPVKLAAQDGSFTMVWKNFKAGPQDPSLFTPPADYKVITPPTDQGGPPGGGK
jgi:hypothetical protein